MYGDSSGSSSGTDFAVSGAAQGFGGSVSNDDFNSSGASSSNTVNQESDQTNTEIDETTLTESGTNTTVNSENKSDSDVQADSTHRRSNDFRQTNSKQKSIKYQVEGGTNLEFTHHFYSEDFGDYFSSWVNSVVQDPKSVQIKAKPISDLLFLNAFEFFPQCSSIHSVENS